MHRRVAVFLVLDSLGTRKPTIRKRGGIVDTDFHISDPFPRTAMQRYSAALAAAFVALLLSRALTPFAGAVFPYLAVSSALVFSALFCGVRPSAVATFVAIFGIRYWFGSPAHSFSVPDAPQSLGLLAFLLLSGVVVAMGEIHRRGREALRKTHDDLEGRVRERTAELATANEELGDLTARLLQLQDEERRRIARELHDSVGQSLAALNMNLSSLGADLERLAKATSTVSDSTALVNDMTQDIRTISYLLHPPLLDEAGLASALKMYIQGFTERSKITVELQFPDHFDRLPRDLETTIFRLVQESLTNIHRHSESPAAEIRVVRSENEVRVEVQDQGKGIPPEKTPELLSNGTSGVGIRGMRERLRQLGGSLEITSEGNGRGTVVVARVPLVNARAMAATATAGSTA
jgi:signal transduction histidine kinase